MDLISCGKRWSAVWLCLIATASLVHAQTDSANTTKSSWLDFEHCPIFAIDSLDIPAQENGLLAKLETRVNDEIRAGQVLGNLDQTSAQLDESLAVKQAQVALAMANDDHDLKFAQLLVEEAAIALESYEQIHSRGAATDAELRSKRLAVSNAELKVQHAKQTTDQLKLKARLAQASVAAAAERLNRLKLVAPFDGTIAEVYRQPGEWVQVGQPIVRLIRLDELRVDVHISIRDVDMVSLIDAPVIVIAQRAGMAPVQFSGRVTHYDPVVSSTGDVRVHATIQNQRLRNQWLLLPGMTARMKIQPPNPRTASLLPSQFERKQ